MDKYIWHFLLLKEYIYHNYCFQNRFLNRIFLAFWEMKYIPNFHFLFFQAILSEFLLIEFGSNRDIPNCKVPLLQPHNLDYIYKSRLWKNLLERMNKRQPHLCTICDDTVGAVPKYTIHEEGHTVLAHSSVRKFSRFSTLERASKYAFFGFMALLCFYAEPPISDGKFR